MTRREWMAGGLLASSLAIARPQTRRYTFRVLGLLHPRRLLLWPQMPAHLLIRTAQGTRSIEGSQSCLITAADTPVTVSCQDGHACDFILEIPGVLRREYRGELGIFSYGDELISLVTMDPETAVSSITGAELPVSGSPREALMAQAVVARSFLIAAARRHKGFDFCDTTHCQFLRSPAAVGSPVDHAVRSTSGLTLESQGAIIPCRYSAACGGHTDRREELGYRYQSVECEGCLLNHYARRGHGLGLCQEGAIYLARRAWSYERILALYLPGTRLTA
jgi:peptidoglycan hydrolase-like amidase